MVSGPGVNPRIREKPSHAFIEECLLGRVSLCDTIVTHSSPFHPQALAYNLSSESGPLLGRRHSSCWQQLKSPATK